MNMANRAITRTFTDSNCFSYLLSLSLSLQCLVVSLKVSSSCTSLVSGVFFIEKPLTRGLCLLNFPQSPLLKIVNLASLLFPIPPGCPRVLSQGKADDHDMCIRQPFSLIIIFQAHLVILLDELQQLLQSGISLNLRTGPTGHTTLFNQ